MSFSKKPKLISSEPDELMKVRKQNRNKNKHSNKTKPNLKTESIPKNTHMQFAFSLNSNNTNN